MHRYSKQLALLLLIMSLIVLVNVEKGYAAEKVNFSYIYSISKNEYIKHVDRANNSINIVSPNYFDLSKTGDLIITANFDGNFIKEMHNRNIKVVPFLSNHWDKESGLNALKNADVLSTKIVEQVHKNNLDGVNIDIEGLSHTERDAFTEFIKTLKSKMPVGKELSVAVAANPKESKIGWNGSYDYNALAKYADYLIIMAYDESYRGSKTPGPVASSEFIEKSIQYALKENVPSNKIVLGIPFYGRMWKSDDVIAGSGFLGESVWMSKSAALLNQFGGRSEYVPEKASMVAKFTISETDSPFKLFSWKDPLTPGDYELWFDNDQTLQKKLTYVNQYNLKGTANWSLGQESTSIWTAYKTWLNPTVAVSNPTDIEVYINGEHQVFDQVPIIQSGSTLVPMRGIFEALGAVVNWDAETGEITARTSHASIWLKANSKNTTVNGVSKEIDVPAQIIAGRTLVPLRFVGEALGATVTWVAETRDVLIDKAL
ncbi:stalk domain-containing protein [Bacillus sp. Marseille-P3661]|uniref:stalk domain-containing protein n=1 Tax=Bacillus sp. Marseille-P3661 TaxID=1936234 RepID=UPI000C830BAD|nr:glycosyl hydrolase family 18 protein [Bacillus sp. Marseille-P3661]